MTESDKSQMTLYAHAYQQTYAAVLDNPHWYSNWPDLLDEQFNAKNTRQRARTLIEILHRAARRRSERHLTQRYLSLAEKLSECGQLDRCGSAGCLECLRAFQQAKAAAHRRLIRHVSEIYPKAIWYLVTIIPREINFAVGSLHEFDAAAFNRHFRETLACIGRTRPVLGSIDFSLEPSPVGKYWQPHWHFPLPTHDPELLRKNLKAIFPPISKHDYPVDVKEIYDLHCLPYTHKVIRIKDLLRTGRRHLPELLLTLDRINPLDLMMLQGLVLSAQDGGLSFELASPSSD